MGLIRWPIFNCCTCIPHRVYVCIVSFLGLTISYVMRFCFSLALTEMAQAPKTKEDPDACPYPPGFAKDVINKTYDFNWTEEQQGLIHSSFFWGYVVTQIPGGMLAEKFGAKIMLTIFVGSTSIWCILTPIFAKILDHYGVMITRLCLGLSQGFVYASLHMVVACWVPKQERGLLGTLVFSGAHAGNTCNNVFTGLMLAYGRWENVFYFWGIIGIIWTIIFAGTTYAFPSDFVNMRPKERTILDAYIEETNKKEVSGPVPWKSIMSSPPVWAIMVAMVGHDWGVFALVTDVPKFMKSVLHYNIKENGLANASIYATMWCIGISSGWLVDFLQRRNYLRTVYSRKICTTIASVGPSLGLLGAAHSFCNQTLAFLSLIFGMGTMGFFYPSLKVNPLDLTVNYAATLGSIGNCAGAAAGVVVTYVIGVMTENSSLAEWRNVFWLTFAVMSLTNIFYIFFASADLQEWNSPPEEEEVKDEKKK